ncbi:MAG: glycosyltransferase family 2 protein [Paracoccaceae bacterium]
MADKSLILTCMKNEGAWLLEWVAFHLSIGFDHILVYSNDCVDGTDQMLDRLAEMGLATRYNNDRKPHHRPSYQLRAYRKARKNPMLEDYAYTAIIDADEFINVKLGDGSVGALIAETGRPDVISLPWRVFGTGGIAEYRPGFVTEAFTWAARENRPRPAQLWGMKSLFRTEAIAQFGLHRPVQPEGGDWSALRWVNPAGTEMPERYHAQTSGNWRFDRETIDYSAAQINHYAVKFRKSYITKVLRGSAHGGIARDETYFQIMNQNEEPDHAIARLLPAAKARYADLLTDPVLAQWDAHARAWHEDKITTALRSPEGKELLDRLSERDKLPENQKT